MRSVGRREGDVRHHGGASQQGAGASWLRPASLLGAGKRIEPGRNILIRLARASRLDDMPETVRFDELPITTLMVACPRPLAPMSHVMLLIDIGGYIGSALASGRLRVFFVARRGGCIGSALASGRLRVFFVARRGGSSFPCGALVMTARALLLIACRGIFTAVLVVLLRRRDSLIAAQPLRAEPHQPLPCRAETCYPATISSGSVAGCRMSKSAGEMRAALTDRLSVLYPTLMRP
jgi:hypothetical protein